MTRPREVQWMASDDPQLRRMLATHIHCGEDMQPVARAGAGTDGPEDSKDAAGQVTYRCACGFSFDEKAE
ncbi:hypothetical protein [Pseudarthrobacter sp. NIBRBAC000502771]|uniref:hypothetical protein n=1 Tax=Pseudarthrobacter sp. NIBRBAC000502771 TaxID=2590774 RepID=UPI0011301409|nr:hypothetical protein [Pseudarthrobacter sp. NIBRBAC000502771]QDG63758.1 hypothetical protein NIBR502771_16455 [Pseudarthrobacter sp. NIBRBAC000502771]